MTTTSINSENLCQIGMDIIQGAFLGAATGSLGVKLYQALNQDATIDKTRMIAISAILGGAVGGLASLSLDSDKQTEIRKLTLGILIVEVIVLCLTNEIERNQVVENCKTNYDPIACKKSIKDTAVNTMTSIAELFKACHTGPNWDCFEKFKEILNPPGPRK